MPEFNVISIHGTPRSGTSWLGKIFDSHPAVAYRYQPLFSYRFKDAITPKSSTGEIEDFLNRLYEVDDDEFILQTRQSKRGAHPFALTKSESPAYLVMKEVRYHYLMQLLLEEVTGIKLIGIVRHPCGVINSWFKTSREYNPQWNKMEEWREAPSKNGGRMEEYYGFSKWKELACQFMHLERSYPQSFYLLKYEDLVSNPIMEISKLFSFCNLDLNEQVHEFLRASQATEVNDPDTVYRTADVVDRWKVELDINIQNTIITEVSGTPLARFL
jgi:hypothetical protein